MSAPRFQLRNKPGCEDQLSTANNVELLLDGKPLAVKYMMLVASATAGPLELHLVLAAPIDVDININPTVEKT